MKYIALLRGINVGGHKKFPKANQLHMIQQLGFKDPQLYLHTGNWVFTSEATASAIATQISEAIQITYGWAVPVLIFDVSVFKHVFAACPFSDEIRAQSYFTLLQEIPSPECIQALQQYSYPNEEYHTTEHCVYFYPALGASKAKMSTNFFESKLKVTATSRNYRTMEKLLAIAQSN